nr:uncharacterized protein LOC127317965 isoform X2 [Lolium perenne]
MNCFIWCSQVEGAFMIRDLRSVSQTGIFSTMCRFLMYTCIRETWMIRLNQSSTRRCCKLLLTLMLGYMITTSNVFSHGLDADACVRPFDSLLHVIELLVVPETLASAPAGCSSGRSFAR